MQLALVNGQRQLATPGLKGACSLCGAATVAKCGPQLVWHWAHAGRRHCDPWWENETEWHRHWKSQFSVDEREVVHFDASGEKHIADVKTARGMVIEFQNSPMPVAELRAREAFYGRMMWIVNAALFREQFSILSRLPDPRSAFAQDLVFCEQRPDAPEAMFWRRSENPDPTGLVRIHAMTTIEDNVTKNYVGHHLFHWKHPREVWYSATAPVFFDFGQDILWWLQSCGDRGPRCIKRVIKADLITKNGGVHVTHI